MEEWWGHLKLAVVLEDSQLSRLCALRLYGHLGLHDCLCGVVSPGP